ncbi:MAG: serine hydrolase [Clostridia bacterium]|nr:serine hydrolase [Clostridia bacterium]
MPLSGKRICTGTAALLCLLFLVSCGEPALPYEAFPVGSRFERGERSAWSPVLSPVVEETTGYLYIDNLDDTFVDGEVTVNHSDYEIPPQLLARLLDTMAEYSFKTSFYVIDLETRMSFGLDVDHAFSAASTVKAPFSVFLTREQEKGTVTLGDLLEYQERFKVDGSGDTKNSIPGTLFTLKALFYRMLYNSDNVAYLMLVDHTGEEGFNEYLAEIECPDHVTRLNHWINITPRNLARVWCDIWNMKDRSEYGKLLWEYLTTNQYNDLEVALPEYAPNCAHKSGWNTRGYHESGVVFGVRTYICVVMTETGYRNDCIYQTIRNLDNIMKDYDIWLKNRPA